MYMVAGNAVGFLYCEFESCHRYSYLGPPDMVGQEA